MKKLLAVCIIGLSLGTAGAFADHPDGWGLGLYGRGGWGHNFITDFDAGAMGGLGFTLKAPKLPIYWGINLDFGSTFGVGLTADYYFMEGVFVPDPVQFGYFIGIGGFFTFRIHDDNGNWGGNNKYWDWTGLAVGARVPLGLNVVIPISKFALEIFIDIAPNLGLGVFFFDDDSWYGYYDWSPIGLNIGFAGEFGVRFWF